jgi:hypothetical protein
MFCMMAGMLVLAAGAIALISGQPPWFLLPLGVVLFFASCMPWRRRANGRQATTNRTGVARLRRSN